MNCKVNLKLLEDAPKLSTSICDRVEGDGLDSMDPSPAFITLVYPSPNLKILGIHQKILHL